MSIQVTRRLPPSVGNDDSTDDIIINETTPILSREIQIVSKGLYYQSIDVLLLSSYKFCFTYIMKGNFDFFLRYLLQNHSMDIEEVYWILICRGLCLSHTVQKRKLMF